jgi:hypothetical protein
MRPTHPPLPTGPALVCATTLILAAPPVLANPPEPAATPLAGEDDGTGMPQAGKTVVDGTVRVWSRGSGATRAEAESVARRQAFSRLVQGTAAWVPDWSVERIRKVLQLPFEDRVVAERGGPGGVEVGLQMELPEVAVKAFLQRCRAVPVQSVTLSACIPDAALVSGAANGPDDTLKPGDILLGFADGERERLDMAAIEGMGSAARALVERPLRVDRDGVERTVRMVAIAIPEPDRLRELAPTCGPCCHGHCDDEMLPGRFDR